MPICCSFSNAIRNCVTEASSHLCLNRKTSSWKLHRNMETIAKEKQKFTKLGRCGIKGRPCELIFEHSRIKRYPRQKTADAMTDGQVSDKCNFNDGGIESRRSAGVKVKPLKLPVAHVLKVERSWLWIPGAWPYIWPLYSFNMTKQKIFFFCLSWGAITFPPSSVRCPRAGSRTVLARWHSFSST